MLGMTGRNLQPEVPHTPSSTTPWRPTKWRLQRQSTPGAVRGPGPCLGGPKKVHNLPEQRFPHTLSGGDHLAQKGADAIVRAT